MRVLHVISGIEPENGGPTAALVGHCRAMVAAGTRASVVATWKSKTAFAQAKALEKDGIAVTLLGPTQRPFRYHAAMDETLAAAIIRHDVVHIHAVWEWIEHAAAAACRELKKPYVWTPHGMLDEWNLQRNGLFKRACLAAYLRRDLNAAAAIHVATDFEARNVAKLNLTAPTFVQGFGLDAALLHGKVPRGRFRERIGLRIDQPFLRIALFLGRIQRGKGLETLIPAIGMMVKPTPWLFVIAGPDEGGYRAEIEAQITEQRANHHPRQRPHHPILFTGMLRGEEKLEAIADADLLVAPSAHESFGIAVAEAIALGTRVAVSDQVGLADAIQKNSLGDVLALAPAAWADHFDTVSRERDLSTRARAFARANFDWPTIAGKWAVEYERIEAAFR